MQTNNMKLFFKILVLTIATVLLCAIGYGYYKNEPLPKGVQGAQAEALTDKIQTAINQKAWDSTAAVAFTFRSSHHYLWDKKRDLVQVVWGDNKVIYHTKTGKGLAYENGQELDSETAIKTIKTATDYFNNDSFWLIAPFKLRDPATKRSIVTIKGEKALMVTYSSGGSTPGDSYVWLINDDFTPKAWKMWVSIIPVGGFQTSWEKWQTFPNGLRLATFHTGLFDLKLENVAVAKTIEELNKGVNPFLDFKF